MWVMLTLFEGCGVVDIKAQMLSFYGLANTMICFVDLCVF